MHLRIRMPPRIHIKIKEKKIHYRVSINKLKLTNNIIITMGNNSQLKNYNQSLFNKRFIDKKINFKLIKMQIIT